MIAPNTYRNLSNNRAGCNKGAGWKNILGLGDLKKQNCLKSI